MHYNNTIRCASLFEVPSLNALIRLSSIALGEGYYSSEQIHGLNQHVFGVDTELVEDQTYFVIERDGIKIACGGWSKRATLFGGDQCSTRARGYLNPQTDMAKIRAFFIHPAYARQGLATLLLQHCERQAKQNGFKGMELMSTLPGIKFYEKLGFSGQTIVDYTLPNGVVIQLKPMQKELA